MTRDDLIAAVPVRALRGKPFYVRIQDIPSPWAQQFTQALIGSAQPTIGKEGACAHVYDWISWVNGTWYGGHNAPSGLEDNS
jgi:hypothetical protein